METVPSVKKPGQEFRTVPSYPDAD